ncbi:MAG: hypothetical protein HXS43_06580 [Theionarchaea archaeon]|nr:hypothetical protein [Theionarchaea archaeon]
MRSVMILMFLLIQVGFPQMNEVAEQPFEGYAHVLLTSDLTNDQSKEIIVFDEIASTVKCFDCFLTLLWTLEVEYPVITAAARDVDSDGMEEVFFLEELKSGTFYPYRVISVEPDGTPNWRKFIEVNVHADLQFHFIDADGNPGEEIVIANRILMEDGLERLAFERDRTIISAVLSEGIPYFLTYLPEEASYELYTFDTEPLWKGDDCRVEGTEVTLEIPLCTLFMKAHLCSCVEDWALEPGEQVVKNVRLWADITGDGEEEALFVSDTTIKLLDDEETTAWTWECPDSVESVSVIDFADDGVLELVVATPLKGIRVPSVYIVDSQGSLLTVLSFGLSEPQFQFTDLDGDDDVDVWTCDLKSRGSTLRVYSSDAASGPLDALSPRGVLRTIDPAGPVTAFWKLFAQYQALMLVALLVAASVVLFLVRQRRKRRTESTQKGE